MFKIGLLLGFTAVLLQIAVFLQPLLPKQYQIAPVCETIAQTFDLSALQHHKAMSHADSHMQHMPSMLEKAQSAPAHDHHDLNHQCQYCTVYGHLILPPELDVKEILVRIQVRLLAFQQAFRHVYYALQRLFLLPQGRAPPVFA
ncbi:MULTISPECIES: DUF2946 family protein [Acinetobacter]|uniref:DUF2946 domain-containing protein n=1 Tax=Acinetobacter soli TaxID=487316 RepID=A0A1P8EMZ9_9GAMM|nr:MULTISPECIES: DUF2946 family protein [Acinetobacter]APV37587.1 DUF2946 domain-containing protein [Acinetobacter soli]MBO3640975.1 DUF2946 family protein [Acinetobacter soli]MBO3672735.1 DUF2946 family protein [Acinetobacter soli]MBU3120627.1 DUF2946 family protein [Acinetobacter soli]MCB8769332.1 DUF2946 family protein [Acinetobacter soli]